jgi:SAM-dependent methyltransferase
MPSEKVTREAQDLVRTLSLAERVALEARSWDAWALREQAEGRVALLSGGLAPGMIVPEPLRASFPDPASLWIARQPTSRRASWYWEWAYLAPMQGKRVLQLGGDGEYVIKFVLAGAAQGYCLDPSRETLKLGHRKAEAYGVADRIEFVCGIAEDLPFADDSLDAVYGNAVLHHTLVDLAAREIYRVLRPGGRASFHDPLEDYALARLARQHLPYPGKGDEGVDYPHTARTVADFIAVFDRGEHRESELFGVPIELLRRLGPRARRTAARIARWLAPLDEHLVRRRPPLRRYCKAVAIRVEKDGRAALSRGGTS